MNQKEEKKEIKQPENSGLSKEQKLQFFQEGERREVAKEESTPEEQLIRDELRREIESMELDEGLKQEAAEKAKKIQYLGHEEKIEHLLEDAKTKGVVFAVKIAKQMNDPFILDTLHDILAKEGYYEQFK